MGQVKVYVVYEFGNITGAYFIIEMEPAADIYGDERTDTNH